MRLFMLLPLLWCAAVQAQDIWRQALMDMPSGCRIQMSTPFNAEISFSRNNGGSGAIMINKPLRTEKMPYEPPLVLNFACYEANEDLSKKSVARFDPAKKKWVRDTRQFFEAFGEKLEPEWRKKYDGAIRFHELQAVNSQGFAYTQDDVIGDEQGRRRQLSYCLFHAQKAICGEGTMGLLSMIQKNLKKDPTPLTLRILRSIEFLDDQNTHQTPDPSASAPAQAPAGAR